jgi:general secretion pathway protein I
MIKLSSQNQSGFTLLEILLAISILGVAITVIMQQFSAGLRIARTSQTYTTATIYAKQKLEELQVEEEMKEKEESGSFDDGYYFRVSIMPYEEYMEDEEDEELFDHLPLEMFRLESVVSWKEGEKEKSITLVTLKTVKKKEGL